jgi:hypothetical protein
MADPIRLAAEARPVIAKLHERGDIVVRFKSNRTGFDEDKLDELDQKAPGHFQSDKRVLTINLDTTVYNKNGYLPSFLATVKDFARYPVLTGVTAHEAGHARFSLWGTPLGDPFPTEIPGDTASGGPVSVHVSGNLANLARILEEPRVERLAFRHFSKTWRRGLGFSAAHLILGEDGSDDSDHAGLDLSGMSTVDAAVRAAILIGGRLVAGTLGGTYQSRTACKKVMAVAQATIEASCPDHDDPFYEIMRIVSDAVMCDEHASALPHLESARKILAITHPDDVGSPDGKPPAEPGEESDGDDGDGDGDSKSGDGDDEDGGGEMMRALADALSDFGDDMSEVVFSEIENPGQSTEDADKSSHGSVMYSSPEAPKVLRRESPTPEDRELYRRALEWMERQVAPTVTREDVNQWLPVGGARLDVRSHLRDNMSGLRANQRADWTIVSETVKSAPPVKVAVMLDASGSMRALARPAASIAWAAANAAATLPESRTVSVAYGDAAGVTQAPGAVPARDVAIINTDGGSEDWPNAAEIVEKALWLDAPVEDDQPSNVLVIIVSDLMYGGEDAKTGKKHMAAFVESMESWHAKGYRMVAVGAMDKNGRLGIEDHALYFGFKPDDIARIRECVEFVTPADLFR